MLLRMPVISLAIPLWIVERTHAPNWLVSAVLLLNTLAVMLWQGRVSRGVTSLRGASILVRLSGVLLLVSCAVFALSAADVPGWVAAGILLVAAALQVVGEMMQSAWEISFALAPAHQQGQCQDRHGGRADARAGAADDVDHRMGAMGWLLLGGLFLPAGLINGPVVRWAEAG
jgi:hypothetical protein